MAGLSCIERQDLLRIEISDSDKRKLSHIIRYYRTAEYAQKEPLDWSVHDFPVDSFGDTICSSWTLSRLENGHIILSDDIYINLMAKLGLRFNFTKDVEDEFCSISEKIIDAHDQWDSAHSVNLLHQALSLLQPYAEYAIENIYVEACHQLLVYHTQTDSFIHVTKQKVMKKILSLFHIFPAAFQACLQPMLYVYYYGNATPSELGSVVKKLELNASSSLRARLHSIHYKIYSKHLYQVPILLESEAKLCSASPIQVLEVQSLRTYFECMAQTSDFSSSVKSMDRLLKKYRDQITQTQFSKHRMNIGIYYMRLHDPVLAKSAFYDVLHHSMQHRIPAAIHMFMLHSLYGEEIPTECFSLQDDVSAYQGIHNEIYSTIFEYYSLKNQNVDPSLLEHMITQDIRPYFVHTNDPDMYKVFYKELEALAKKTNNRQPLRNFKRLRRISAQT